VISKVNTKIKCTNCFKSLGIPSRMELYAFLERNGPTSVSKLVEVVNLRQPTVSYHLKEMQDSGILSSTKKGKEVFYHLKNKCLTTGADCVLSNLTFSEVK
jgi:ArsR family transcriptional regulator